MKNVRLWKLGNLEHKISPKKEALEKFTKMIEDKFDDEDTVDIIWGPDVELQVVRGDSLVDVATAEEILTRARS